MLWSASSILEPKIDDLLFACGVAQLIHTRAEEGGLGTADGKQKKMKTRRGIMLT
jgi:hypothetical protein